MNDPVQRWVVLHCAGPAECAPLGVDPVELALAFIADGAERVESVTGVRAAVTAPVRWHDQVVDLVETDTLVLPVGAPIPAPPGSEVVQIAADAPDLPPLLIGKAFRALGHTDVVGGCDPRGWVALLGTRIPRAGWLDPIGWDLERQDLWRQISAVAPRRSAARSVAGWRRLRARDDLQSLDPGLEGWDHTRALLRRSVRLSC